MAIQIVKAAFSTPLTIGDATHLNAWDNARVVEEIRVTGMSVVPDDRWRFELFRTTDHRNSNSGSVLAFINHDGESDVIETTNINANVSSGDSVGIRVSQRPGPAPVDGGPDGQVIAEIVYDDGT